MPRMAKWKEKYECVKNLAPRPVKFVFEEGSAELKTHTIYELIDETFEAGSSGVHVEGIQFIDEDAISVDLDDEIGRAHV